MHKLLREINIMNLMFTKIFRLIWVVFIILLIFLDRDNVYNKIFLISSLIILSLITVFRILDSRNEWRKIMEENPD